MSALAFVHMDGSPQLEGSTRKFVRAHVAKHSHTTRQRRRSQNPIPVEPPKPRLLAPNIQPIAECSLILGESATAMQPLEHGPPASLADIITSDSECLNTETHDWDLRPVTGKIDQQIDLAAAVDLLNSGASREKSLRIGWIQRANSEALKMAVTSTLALLVGNQGFIGTQVRSFASRTKNLDFILPCPQIVDLPMPRSLESPTAISLSPEAQYIVERYAKIVDTGSRFRGLLPSSLPLRNAYMPAARNNDALWYASVSFASAMNQALQGLPADSISLRYKGEAIRAINTRLYDISHQVTDETIAAAQALASVECICGNFEAFGVHLRAVREMVQLRGGLEILGFNSLLSRLIQMQEWRWDLVAHNLQQNITFPSSQPPHQPITCVPPELFTFTLGLSSNKSAVPTGDVSTVLLHLQNLAHTWEKQSSLSSSARSTSFEEGCKCLYDQISTLAAPEKSEALWTAADYEFECLRLACLIYSSKGAETEHTRSKTLRKRLQELYQNLKMAELSKYWTNTPGALIWCLAVGANESWGVGEYSWFMAHFIPMLMMLAMECWNELQTSLSIFGWLLKCGRMGTVIARL